MIIFINFNIIFTLSADKKTFAPLYTKRTIEPTYTKERDQTQTKLCRSSGVLESVALATGMNHAWDSGRRLIAYGVVLEPRASSGPGPRRIFILKPARAQVAYSWTTRRSRRTKTERRIMGTRTLRASLSGGRRASIVQPRRAPVSPWMGRPFVASRARCLPSRSFPLARVKLWSKFKWSPGGKPLSAAMECLLWSLLMDDCRVEFLFRAPPAPGILCGMRLMTWWLFRPRGYWVEWYRKFCGVRAGVT